MFSLRVHPLDDEKSTIHLGIQTWQKHTGLSQEYSQGEIDCFFILSLFPHPLPPLTLPLRYRPCRVDVSLDLVSLLAVHYHCCGLLTFCSAVQKDFFTKKCYEPR